MSAVVKPEPASGKPASRGSAKVEETRRMSDLLCAPCRPGQQVGISERRNLYRPRRCQAGNRNLYVISIASP